MFRKLMPGVVDIPEASKKAKDTVLGDKDKTDASGCSSVVDAVVFNPDVLENSRTILISPEAYHLPFEVVHLSSKDGTRLMGYLILQEEISHYDIPTIIFYHGNSGNIGDRLLNAKKLYRDMGVNLFLVEYRGFGFSHGQATEYGVYLDAQAAFDYIDQRPDIDSKQIVLFGRSLGGAIVINLASQKAYKDRIALVVVENTFTSLTELAWNILPTFMMPIVKLFRLSSKFRNYDKVSEISRPALFISGLRDDLIPPTHMTKLYMACRTRKRILRFHDGNHLNSWTIKGYTKAFRSYIDEVLQNHPIVDFPKEFEQLRDKN